MAILWVVVANSCSARFYEVAGYGRKIENIQIIEHPEGRKKDGELYSDRPGRTFDRMGPGRHSFSPEIDRHLREQQIFAKKIGEFLKKAQEENKFEELALIAPSQFLGELKKFLPNSVKKSLINQTPSDLPETLSEKEVQDHICRYLNLWNRAEK